MLVPSITVSVDHPTIYYFVIFLALNAIYCQQIVELTQRAKRNALEILQNAKSLADDLDEDLVDRLYQDVKALHFTAVVSYMLKLNIIRLGSLIIQSS